MNIHHGCYCYLRMLFWLADPMLDSALGDVVQDTILDDEFLCFVLSCLILILIAAKWIFSAVKIVVGCLVGDLHEFSPCLNNINVK